MTQFLYIFSAKGFTELLFTTNSYKLERIKLNFENQVFKIPFPSLLLLTTVSV